MRLLNIAFSNLRVRKIKIFFLLLGIILGVAIIVSLTGITLAMQEQLESKFEDIGMRVLVTPKSNSLFLSYHGISVHSGNYARKTIPEKIAHNIKQFGGQNVTAISPKLVQNAEIKSKKMLIAGISREELNLKPYWRINGKFPNRKQILLGASTAQRLKLSVEDKVPIKGEIFTVSGILNETGTVEDELVFINLAEAQRVFNRNKQVTFIELSVNDKEAISALRSKFTSVAITEVKGENEERQEIVNRFAKFAVLISICVLLIGFLIISTTMMSSVKERTREIGIFRALGFKRKHIVKIILFEAVVVSTVGGVVGYIGGILLVKLISPYITQFEVQLYWSPELGLATVIMSILVGLLASAYPAYQAARLDPIEAIRFI